MTCSEHDQHEHRHGPGCGHREIRHGDHATTSRRHLHAPHEDTRRAPPRREPEPPGACAPVECDDRHAPGCGHEAVPHGTTRISPSEGPSTPPRDHCDLHGNSEAAGRNQSSALQKPRKRLADGRAT